MYEKIPDDMNVIIPPQIKDVKKGQEVYTAKDNTLGYGRKWVVVKTSGSGMILKCTGFWGRSHFSLGSRRIIHPHEDSFYMKVHDMFHRDVNNTNIRMAKNNTSFPKFITFKSPW